MHETYSSTKQNFVSGLVNCNHDDHSICSGMGEIMQAFPAHFRQIQLLEKSHESYARGRTRLSVAIVCPWK